MEKIQQVISEIHEKAGRLRESLNRVETDNVTLKDELNVLKEKLSKTEQEAADFRKKYEGVKGQLQNAMSSDEVESRHDKGEQIDLLVREIDDCINRLKA